MPTQRMSEHGCPVLKVAITLVSTKRSVAEVIEFALLCGSAPPVVLLWIVSGEQLILYAPLASSSFTVAFFH